ncbi:hypothetical protein CROQUDRAFT_91313 [Cronartium quercuum f. sp. fusiforme G11]|uniref:Uncharacterized protein n=1 Tax=Cronartium quercuum f. sp. fusiforme G11 TaxID=708437 RepID=A0A9P6NNX7_9BASI|nr:hypothetical protein CROQUDRAFT_91313 [Cronartium quercuum f. sp. fusiforme G11]
MGIYGTPLTINCESYNIPGRLPQKLLVNVYTASARHKPPSGMGIGTKGCLCSASHARRGSSSHG